MALHSAVSFSIIRKNHFFPIFRLNRNEIGVSGSNWFNNNMNAVSLARTHWPMQSAAFEMGQYHPRLRLGWYCPHLLGLRLHWPVRPRQTHGILSVPLHPKKLVFCREIYQKSWFNQRAWHCNMFLGQFHCSNPVSWLNPIAKSDSTRNGNTLVGESTTTTVICILGFSAMKRDTRCRQLCSQRSDAFNLGNT